MAYRPTNKEVERALVVLGRALRIGAGRMPQLKYPAVREAFRILSLRSFGGIWQETPATWARLEAAGVDPQTFLIVDEGAFEEMRHYLAAIKEPKQKRHREQVDLAAETTHWPMADTRIKPKVTEGYRRVDEPTDTTDGQEQSADSGIMKITDLVMNPEFEAEAKARRDACCIAHGKPQPTSNSGVRKPGPTEPWPYPW